MIIQAPAPLKGSNINVSPLIHSSDQPYLMNGCHNTWKLGAITKDTGYIKVGETVGDGKGIRSLYNFRQLPGTEKILATSNNTTDTETNLYYLNGSVWTPISTGWTKKDINVEFESFIGYCFMVGEGGGNFIDSASLTGTTFSTATNVTSMPMAKYIKRYKDRIYIAHCYNGGLEPFRVYFSSIPVAGGITWTPSTDFLDVDYSESITGIETAWDVLVAFTEYRMWIYDLSTWKARYDYGCSSHRTIKKHGSYLIWCNFDGVWVSTGGQPQCISGEVEDLYRAGNPRNYFAEVVDENYYLYIGDVSTGDISYKNLVLVFNIAKSNWWIRELNHKITSFSKFNNSGILRLYMGSSEGEVFNKGKYTDSVLLTSDNGFNISSSFELAPISFKNLDKVKLLKKVIAYADRAGGLKLKVRSVDNSHRVLTPYEPIGTLEEFINILPCSVEEGVILQVAGEEVGKNPYWSFLGYCLDVETVGNLTIK